MPFSQDLILVWKTTPEGKVNPESMTFGLFQFSWLIKIKFITQQGRYMKALKILNQVPKHGNVLKWYHPNLLFRLNFYSRL